MLEIEVDGAQQVKRLYPDALLIFVLPPSRDEQERRLRGRGDPNDKVLARLNKAEVEEPIGRELADYVVVNDDLDTTVDEMLSIIKSARGRGRLSGTMAMDHDTMINPPIEQPARHGRLEVLPGHARRPPGAQHQLVLQPAR